MEDMADTVDVKNVVKNLVNGSLEQTMCIVCLMPLDELCENIFTRICKEDKEYCIADVFEQLFHMKFADTANFNVCSDCFISASSAYKFYLLAKRSNEILQFYVNEVDKNLNMVELPEDLNSYSICLSLPIFEPKTPPYDYDLEGLSMQEGTIDDENFMENNIKIEKEDSESDEDLIIVTEEDGKKVIYKPQIDGSITEIRDTIDYGTPSPSSSEHNVSKKRRRKRLPMEYRSCSLCPIKYRFIAKLKEHMKVEHNVDLYVCKVCKAVMEDKEEYHNHLKTHSNIHICVVCEMVFKRRDTIIAHLKRHEALKNMTRTDGAHICEICGLVLLSEEYLKEHYDKKHDKKYTCYYCGRMYKGELSLNLHIKKHEAYMKLKDRKRPISDHSTIKAPVKTAKETGDRQYKCVTCNRDFVDQRALLWHNRLHTNERPYTCDVCGRGFVSVNRRNQHAMCAHTAPARRCPLCPALFHLRSMVNTHIKKVHLKAHKRRNRTSKYQEVYWRTETVPIQELSVDIQSDLLDMQTKHVDVYCEYGNNVEL